MKKNSAHSNRNKDTQKPALRELLQGRLSRFHFGWMLLFSVAFGAFLLMAFNGVEILTSHLISSSGHVALTSGDYGFFFQSWQGYVTIAILLVSTVLIIGIILNSIIFLSDNLFHERYQNPLSILIRSIRSIRIFACKEAIPIILYFIVFITFFVITLLSLIPNPFEIPGYIRYRLSKNILSMLIYAGALVLVSFSLINNPLIAHDMLLGQKSPEEAYKRTRSYVRTNRRQVLTEMLVSLLTICVILVLSGAVFLYLPKLCQILSDPLPLPVQRIIVLTTTYLGLLLLAFAVLMSPWILTITISELYDRMLESEGLTVASYKDIPRSKPSGSKFLRRTLLILFIALFAASVVLSYLQFNYIYPPAKNIEAVVHRLGGDMDTENTMEGLMKAIELEAPAVETDIQRTKDGEYVIFHDATPKRMCGTSGRISEMTLEEVQALKLPSPVFEEERRIPLLSEVLDAAKGKIQLYLELKGKTADIKMAKDVARMVRQRGMEEDCVLISMNYSLISYIHRHIPDIPCGYLYFFAYGLESKLNGNILMAQSNAINSTRTRAIHSQGKKVYCWTVNSMQTAQNMVRQRVDGIITDRYDIVASVLDHIESRNDYERIMDVLLS